MTEIADQLGLRPHEPFTLEEYKNLLREMYNIKQRHWPSTASKMVHQLLLELPPIYQTKLPVYLLARCPICGGEVTEAVDTISLSGTGWWISDTRGFGWFGREIKWVYEVFRPLFYPRHMEPSYTAGCEHVRAMSYGVNLNGIFPDDIVHVGRIHMGSEKPGVWGPFMAIAGSFAVIHTLGINRLDEPDGPPRYTAYFITYFNEDKDSFEQSFAPKSRYDKRFVWPHNDLDYNLSPWLENGKLYWLGPEADGLPLRQEPGNEYPYYDMDGLIGRWSASAYYGAWLLPSHNNFGEGLSQNYQNHIRPIVNEALKKHPLKKLDPNRLPYPRSEM